jgi:hypothetical protein
MTVSTNHVAFRDFGDYIGPAVVAHALRDVERLVSAVVELEDNGVGLATVGARMR